MKFMLTHNSATAMTGASRRAGATLIEVLSAIFVLGIGLLALLVLFPLGALSMAQSVKDDRTRHFAQDAVAFSQAGAELLSRTGQFVAGSLSTGSADPKTAGVLQKAYEEFGVQAAGLEVQLRELRPYLPTSKSQQQADGLLAQLRAIKQRIDILAQLFRLLKEGL